MKQLSIEEIRAHVNGRLTGSQTLYISNLAQIDEAKFSDLTFVGNKKYLENWQNSKASAAIVDHTLEDKIICDENKAIIFVENADLAMAKVLELFAQEPPTHKNIHPTAIIEDTATIGKNVSIGPHSYIGHHCSVGDNTQIYANVCIYDNSSIGTHCTIWSGALVRERTIIGDYCTLHANCSIGNDGFGYRAAENGKGVVKIPHIGNVIIGNHVDIGASSCIDKGKFSSTIIGDFTKIDNLVQIGHNCIIGKGCIICGAVGMSGSVIVGDGATIAGGAGIKDHVKIGKGSVVAARSGVMNDIPDGITFAGYPADSYSNAMRQWAAVRNLPETIRTVNKLAKKLSIQEKENNKKEDKKEN